MAIGSTVEVVPTNQIIAILNDDSIDVKLLKVADKFHAIDSNLTRCMMLRLYTLRAIFKQHFLSLVHHQIVYLKILQATIVRHAQTKTQQIFRNARFLT